MLFWVLVAAITLAVVAVLARPLLRSSTAPTASRAEYDRAIYRDQLAEVERDRARGVIGAAEAEAAQHEVERRLLATTRGAAPASAAATSGARRSWRAAAVAVAVPAVALGMYAALGSPGLPDVPAAATSMQAANDGAPHEEGDASLAAAAKKLDDRLAQNPNDAQGWLLLARTRAVLRQWRESEVAFQKAIDLTGGAADALAGYGEMIVMSADGTVSPTAKNFFQRALAKDPRNVVARFYLGLAEVQAGKPADAVARWRALAAEAPKDATWRAPLEAQIAAAAKQAGIEPSPEELAAASAAGAPAAQPEAPPEAQAGPPAAVPGPTPEQMQAAQSMSPEDRLKMIRGMVAGLAERLKANPNDPAGWQRLARAYEVLGETDKAKDALSHVKDAAPAAPQAAEAPPPSGSAMPGPTPEQMRAAQSMSSEDRQNMIRGMVARLAEKMKANPDDADGWLRLGRAYTVLGENDKAADALAHAAKLRPDDPAPLVGQAQALLATVPMDGSKPLPPEFLSVAKKLESMSADSPDALWYIGLAAKQEKRTDVARKSWSALLAKLDPQSQEAEMVKGAIDKLGK